MRRFRRNASCKFAGATESLNWAIKQGALAVQAAANCDKMEQRDHIIITEIEHVVVHEVAQPHLRTRFCLAPSYSFVSIFLYDCQLCISTDVRKDNKRNQPPATILFEMLCLDFSTHRDPCG